MSKINSSNWKGIKILSKVLKRGVSFPFLVSRLCTDIISQKHNDSITGCFPFKTENSPGLRYFPLGFPLNILQSSAVFHGKTGPPERLGSGFYNYLWEEWKGHVLTQLRRKKIIEIKPHYLLHNNLFKLIPMQCVECVVLQNINMKKKKN